MRPACGFCDERVLLMSTLKIGTYEERIQFRPGEAISGRILWLLDEPEKAESADVRLFWYTEGKGSRDVEVVDTAAFDVAGRHGEVEFAFTAPPSPYSFSGKLISLRWALELVMLPTDDTERLPITISPTGDEVSLINNEEIEAGE
jgi:hypothetical protein